MDGVDSGRPLYAAPSSKQPAPQRPDIALATDGMQGVRGFESPQLHFHNF